MRKSRKHQSHNQATKKAQFKRITKLSAKTASDDVKNNITGTCFVDHYNWITKLTIAQYNNYTIVLVHGIKETIFGKKFVHAWIELKHQEEELVLFISGNQEFTINKTNYYQQGNIDSNKCKYYTKGEVYQNAANIGTYGPWDEYLLTYSQ